MFEKIKNFINKHKSELCLGSLGVIGYLVLDNKIKKSNIMHLNNHIENQQHIETTLGILNNTQDNMIELVKESE